MKFLVFTTDIIPLPGAATSGTALRTYGLAEGLRALGHEVVISVPKTALAGFERSHDLSSLPGETQHRYQELRQLGFDSRNQSSHVKEIDPDVILCGHWPAMMLPTKPRQPIVVDLAGPHLLERHHQGSDDQEAATRAKLAVIATADYFIVSGPSQRLYFLSFMLRAGLRDAEKKITTIPMPLNPRLPTRGASSEAYPRFVFGGVFLPWQDPSWGLRRLSSELHQRAEGNLLIIGGKHPNHHIDEGQYGKLFSELEREPRVERKPMLAFESFIDELTQRDIAIDIMKWNLERQLAVTIRSTTYLWAGLPVIYNDFADLAQPIRDYDAGWCVQPGDEDGLRKVFDEIWSAPDVVAAKGVNAQRLARELFSWDTCAEKLLTLLAQPRGGLRRETDIAIEVSELADFFIYGERTLRQEFVCRMNGLSRIECLIATHRRTPLPPVTFRVTDASRPDQVFVEERITEERLKNNEWLAIEMAPIKDSGGRHFVIEIESPQGNEANSISPWGIKCSPYPLVSLHYAGKRIDNASLCLRTQCVGAS